jgi:hypothetical protein
LEFDQRNSKERDPFTGVAWLSSARVVERLVKSSNERNPLFLFEQKKLPSNARRKVRKMSSRHGPYELGYTRITKVMTKRSDHANGGESQKNYLSSDCSLKLGSMKLESLVIVDQHATVNRTRV